MSDDEITIQLTITAKAGAPRVPLVISKAINASELRLEASKLTKIPLSSMKIIFRGRLIADDPGKAAVTEYSLENGSVIHCIGKPVEDATPTSSSSAATASSATFPRISTTASAPTPVPTSTIDPMRSALQALRASNPPNTYQTAITTLEKILGNIVDNPMEDKYRKMKKMNPAFQRRLGGLPGGDAAMKASGFIVEQVEGEEQYVMKATESAWPSLVANRNTVKAAITAANPPAFVNPMSLPIVPSPAGINNGLGFTPGSFPNSTTNEAIDNWMSDPATMQAMMQSPMFQTMIRNDPVFANNPMMQTMAQEMANNPQHVAQMSQMMRNPQIRRQMEQVRAMQLQQQGLPSAETNAAIAEAMRAVEAMQQQSGVGGQTPVNMDAAMADAMRAVQALQSASGQPPVDMNAAMADAMRAVQAMQQNGQLPAIDPSTMNAFRNTTGSAVGAIQQQNDTSRAPTNGQPPSSSNDSELTEEEMIAEAIRRSLQDS